MWSPRSTAEYFAPAADHARHLSRTAVSTSAFSERDGETNTCGSVPNVASCPTLIVDREPCAVARCVSAPESAFTFQWAVARTHAPRNRNVTEPVPQYRRLP